MNVRAAERGVRGVGPGLGKLCQPPLPGPLTWGWQWQWQWEPHTLSLSVPHVLPWQARGFPESCMRRPPALPPRLLQGHRGEPQLGAELLRGWKLPEGAYAEASSVLLLVMDMWGSEPGWGAFLIPGLGLLHVGWTPPLVLHGPILASCLTCLGCI